MVLSHIFEGQRWKITVNYPQNNSRKKYKRGSKFLCCLLDLYLKLFPALFSFLLQIGIFNLLLTMGNFHVPSANQRQCVQNQINSVALPTCSSTAFFAQWVAPPLPSCPSSCVTPGSPCSLCTSSVSWGPSYAASSLCSHCLCAREAIPSHPGRCSRFPWPIFSMSLSTLPPVWHF